MGDGFHFFDILLFAAIAGFLVLRLRSVLGRRTGLEQRRDPFTPPPQIVPPQIVPPPAAASGNGAPAGGGLAAVKAADPGFAEAAFLQGARGAFQIIVNAFAAGDTSALQPLLSREVFDSFATAIRARSVAREKLETTLVTIKAADIADAAVENGTAHVTVKFVSDQINVTRAADGKVSDGNPDKVVEHTDYWSFARQLRASNPNWTLIATQSP
jgi:predicted lipid-binding transport protein (Tim44 family)